MSTLRKYRPWVRVENGSALVNGIKAHCYFYLGEGSGRPKHWAFIANMSIETLMRFMARGRLWLARKIRTEEKN